MIDTKKLIEVMPHLSGDAYKVFTYLIMGYDMAVTGYNQGYFANSYEEISNATGVPISTLKRKLKELQGEYVVMTSEKKGGRNARSRFVVKRYEDYTVHDEPVQIGLDKSVKQVQNGLPYKEEEIEKRDLHFEELGEAWRKSKRLRTQVGTLNTLEEINQTKDEFIQLWEDIQGFYRSDSKYEQDKQNHWGAFMKQYNAAKSRINRASSHTPKKVEKKENRDFSENNGGRMLRKRANREWTMEAYNKDWADSVFIPYQFHRYSEDLKNYLLSGFFLDSEQLNRAVSSVSTWIARSWQYGEDEIEVFGTEVKLCKGAWLDYVRMVISGYNNDPINPENEVPESDYDPEMGF